MTRTDLFPWTRLWHEIGAHGDSGPWHRWLVAAYGGPARHYHNLQHLEECLAELDAVRERAVRPDRVAMALWFHDAIYDSRSATNEEDSAARAKKCLEENAVSADTADAVSRLILCTKTHEPRDVPDAALLIDIDLAILGQRAERFWDYERAIRAEYAWVPAPTFAEKRAQILTRFLERPAIYRTEVFRTRYETVARVNLQAAIMRLRAMPT